MHGEILKMYVLSNKIKDIASLKGVKLTLIYNSNRAISNCMNLCHVTMYITKPQFTSQSSDLITIELDIHLFESIKYLPTANRCGVYRRTTALNTVLSVVVMNIPFDRAFRFALHDRSSGKRDCAGKRSKVLAFLSV